MAAYLYLPRRQEAKSRRTSRIDPGMVVDFDDADRPIGIEMTAPSLVTLEDLNRVLDDLEMPPVDSSDLAPLKAA